MEVRTRFAPSPTGYLHIGGARTALFNYLFARKHKGKFVLRVEDTDTQRSTDESIDAILEGMKWLEMDFDEGPFYQSKRFKLYREHAEKLLFEGKAYRCWCTAEELQERRDAAMKAGRPPKYDGKCREKTDGPDEGYTIRFRVPPGKTVFKDLIKGVISIEHEEVEDLIILRSDRTPTYNLTVTIDDATMGITHVIRGDDHINNTPKQMLMYEALGFKIPEFAHLPMILGADKKRLSKRHGAESVTAYREMGFLPHALINYLARLGWAHGDEEIFSKAELIEKFSIEAVGTSAGVFNPDKLLWLNQHYLKEDDPIDIAPALAEQLKTLGVECDDMEYLAKVIVTLRERSKTLKDMAEGAKFYFVDKIEYDEKAEKKFLKPENADISATLSTKLSNLTTFNETSIEGVFNEVMEETELKLGKIAQPVRVALTGTTISPGIFETIETLGQQKTVERLKNATEHMRKKE